MDDPKVLNILKKLQDKNPDDSVSVRNFLVGFLLLYALFNLVLIITLYTSYILPFYSDIKYTDPKNSKTVLIFTIVINVILFLLFFALIVIGIQPKYYKSFIGKTADRLFLILYSLLTLGHSAIYMFIYAMATSAQDPEKETNYNTLSLYKSIVIMTTIGTFFNFVGAIIVVVGYNWLRNYISVSKVKSLLELQGLGKNFEVLKAGFEIKDKDRQISDLSTQLSTLKTDMSNVEKELKSTKSQRDTCQSQLSAQTSAVKLQQKRDAREMGEIFDGVDLFGRKSEKQRKEEEKLYGKPLAPPAPPAPPSRRTGRRTETTSKLPPADHPLA